MRDSKIASGEGLVQFRAFDAEACLFESRDDIVDRLRVPGFALDLDHRVLGGQRVEDPAVADFDDVRACLVDLARDRGERARLVLDRDSKPRDAPA